MEDTLYIINVENDAIKRSIKHGFSSMYLRDWYHHENALLVNLPGPVAAKFDLDSLTISQISKQSSQHYMTTVLMMLSVWNVKVTAAP